ncbi:MAG: germination protein YpeB [Eubacteriales bacterium]
MPKKWLYASFLGVFALVAMGAWGYEQYRAKKSLEIYLNNNYQRAFFNLSGQTQRIEVLLSKSLVASDPRLDLSLLSDIRQEANFAQSNLTQLPLADVMAGRTAKFFTQVADYADSLSRQVNQGSAIEKDHWDTLRDLYNQSVSLNSELQGIQGRMAKDNYYFSSMVREVRKSLQKTPGNLAASDFQVLDKRMERYPTLIYDGPFSEHLERAEPEALKGMPDIDASQAKAAALNLIDRRPGVNYHSSVSGAPQGRIPAFRVDAAPEGSGGDKSVVDISRRGGQAIWLINSRPVGDPGLTVDEARGRALNYLAGKGYGEMQPSYFIRQGNTVTYNFASVQDGVIIYPDLVKVTVALDNGEVTGLEATGYLMSHKKRDLPKPKLTADQARASLNPRLAITGGRPALIPAGVNDEQLTYEFQGKLNEETFLIYVNALTGREERVLKLIDTPGGTLTM